MKLLRQFLIILVICFAGEFLNRVISLPIPGNVIGMIILFISLVTGVIKLKDIEDITRFLLEHLGFFFIPAGVGLMASMNLLKANLSAFLIISIITTVMVIIVTGYIVQVLKRGIKR